MKTKTIILIAIPAAILLVIVLIFGWGVSAYNSLVGLDEDINGSWSQVENQYQRRIDLIPNLVETVKGYAGHEREVFEHVAEARSSVGKIQVTPEILNNPQMMQRFQAAQGELSSALTRLLAVSENYPDLKANENFLQLQAQLEGTENRIAVERRRFNQVVQQYNTKIRTVPTSMIAGMTGFTSKAYFEAQPEAERVPEVKF